ncbi:MAG: MauE/DoxX family redox-associated membrane protein [Pyrinomonadaceae bacterium]
MEIVLLVIRLSLAAVFGVAGIAKLFDPAGSEKALGDFGVPRTLARPMVYVLPAFELAIAIALLFVQSSWFGAFGATALFVIFTGGMLYQMVKGNAPDCHCFGQLHSEPVGIGSIVRNLVMLIPAVILVTRGQANQGLNLVNSNQDIMQFVIGLAVVALLLTVVLFLKTISEQQSQIMRRIELMELVSRDGSDVEREDIGHPNEGLPIGALVPDFELPDLDGNVISLAAIRKENIPVLFIFVSPTCTPCRALVPEFERWQNELNGKVKVVFVSNREAEDNRKKFAGQSTKLILLQKDREVAELFRAKWTPMAVLMDTAGRIASFTAAGDLGLRDLVHKIEAAETDSEFSYFTNGNLNPHAPIKIGESVPEISVSDQNGNQIDSSYFRGKETLVTFWSPTCGYCVQMMDEIRDWDAVKGSDDPNLLIFSEGDLESHLDLGIKSSIISDAENEIAKDFGKWGTPSGVMINKDGKFVSELAVGAADIWALIGKRK